MRFTRSFTSMPIALCAQLFLSIALPACSPGATETERARLELAPVEDEGARAALDDRVREAMRTITLGGGKSPAPCEPAGPSAVQDRPIVARAPVPQAAPGIREAPAAAVHVAHTRPPPSCNDPIYGVCWDTLDMDERAHRRSLDPSPSEAAPAPIVSADTESTAPAAGGEQLPPFDGDTSPPFNGDIIE
jgi:hypothetical protein